MSCVSEKKEENIQVHIYIITRINGEIYGDVLTVFFVIENNTVYQRRRNKDLDLYRSSQLRLFGGRRIFFRRASQLLWSSRFVVLRDEERRRSGRSTSLVSRVALLLLFLLLAQVDEIHVPAGMAFADVSARVRAVPSAVDAVRALESWFLAALVFLMVGQTALEAEDATAIRAGKLLRARIRPDRRRRRRRCYRHRRRIRLEDVAPRRDSRKRTVIHLNLI